MAELKNIASKLVKIMAACDYVQKGGVNKFHNYKYASAADVLEKVNAACVANNVASITYAKILSEKEKANKSGALEYLVTVEMTLNLIDGDSGESLTIISLGTGQDPGDKAVAKAQTMALKYAWMAALNISTGDDPEADEGVDERMAGNVKEKASTKTQTTSQRPTEATQASQPTQAPPREPRQKLRPDEEASTGTMASEPQQKAIHTIAKQKNIDIYAILGQDFGVESTASLTKQQASQLIDRLQKEGLKSA